MVLGGWRTATELGGADVVATRQPLPNGWLARRASNKEIRPTLWHSSRTMSGAPVGSALSHVMICTHRWEPGGSSQRHACMPGMPGTPARWPGTRQPGPRGRAAWLGCSTHLLQPGLGRHRDAHAVVLLLFAACAQQARRLLVLVVVAEPLRSTQANRAASVWLCSAGRLARSTALGRVVWRGTQAGACLDEGGVGAEPEAIGGDYRGGRGLGGSLQGGAGQAGASSPSPGRLVRMAGMRVSHRWPHPACVCTRLWEQSHPGAHIPQVALRIFAQV